MKQKLTLLLLALVTSIGVWAETATWTSGVAFLTATSSGNYTTGWFSMVMPASGTMSKVRINLGVNNSRVDAYLAISKDLKQATTGFSSSDFVAISTNKCGTSEYDVTMTFSSGDLVGGSTYYFYWVTESDGTYTTVNQRYDVGAQDAGVQMSIGQVGSTSAQSTAYDPRFSCEMSVKANTYYRMRALYPDDLCYLYSQSSNENKIFKTTSARSVTSSRYIWKTTLGESGIYIQNVGNSHYIAKINGSNAGDTYLSATAVGDAEQFTIVANNPARSYNYSGYIALKSTTNANSYLNCFTSGNDYVGSYTVADNKSGQFMFQQVKGVTFSHAVKVNGGDAVSTIYVACDGSDSFTLPSDYKYTISGVDYNAVDAAATIAAAGTSDISVTVKFVENSKKYRLMQKWTSTSYYLYSNTADGSNGNRLWKSSTKPDVTNTNYLWEAQSSGDYWKFYNVGGERWIATASGNSQDGTGVNGLSATTVSDAEAFNLMPAVTCGYPPSDFSSVSYVALKATSRETYLNSYNSNNNYVGWHNAVHAGYYFKFIPVNTVTFSEAVAVNGGDAVSTIYVAADGSDSFTLPTNKLYSINGGEAVGCTEAASAIASCSSDITVTVSSNSTKDVTYTLNWSDGTTIKTVENVTTDLLSPSSAFLPSAFASDFVTLSYSPETITNETTKVTVTATWNGPFQISDDYASAKWYTVGIHSAHEDDNHIWKYDSGNSDIIATEAVATNAYASLSDKNYFCFVGNPYDGFSIYNKAAGSGMTLYKSATNAEHAKMAAEGSLFIPGASSESSKTIAKGYACFILKDGSVRLNCYDSDSYNVNGWTDSGNGSTCWFKTPSSYPLNYLNTLVLDAPAGSVGTVDVAADVLSAGKDLKDYFAGDPFYFATANAVEKNMVLQTLNKLDEASEITLADGYYRVVSAVAGFNATAAWYYNPAVSTTNIVWAKAATTTEHQVNSIFKFTANEDKWNIYSPNAQQYITTGNGTWAVQNAALGDAAGLEVTSIGAAQYTLKQSNNAQTLHADGHGDGSGTSGNLITWNSNNQGEASTWYIVKVDELPLTLNDGGDGYYYATVCLPFDVTLSAACAYTLTLNAGKTGLTMSEATDNVPAGTPVMLRHTKGTVTASIANDAATSAPLTTTALTGTYLDKPVTIKTDYFLGKANDKVGFYLWDGTTLKANRAYLEASKLNNSGVKGFALDFEDDATGINEELRMKNEESSIYNLAGQRMNKMQKGINIINGKKILK